MQNITQHDLFGAVPYDPAPVDPAALARAQAVAERAQLTPLEAKTYQIIKAAGLHGSTSHETAAALGLGRDSISPRHTILRAKGLVMETPGRRDGQTVWRAVYL